MKVYLSHNFGARQTLRAMDAAIRQLGIETTSEWIHIPMEQKQEDRDNSYLAQNGQMDLVHTLMCEIFVYFADQFGETPGRGKYFELGAAVATSKMIIAISEDPSMRMRECVFLALPQITWVADELEAIRLLQNIYQTVNAHVASSQG